jgi:hypothetical protein
LLLFLFWLFNPSGPALRAGTGPQRRVAEDRRAKDREEAFSPYAVLEFRSVDEVIGKDE